MKPMGSFLLSHELLSQALHLPPETVILGVLDHDRHTCRILVTHPDIIENVKLKPVFHNTYRDPEEYEQITETKLDNWGIEKPE